MHIHKYVQLHIVIVHQNDLVTLVTFISVSCNLGPCRHPDDVQRSGRNMLVKKNI